MSIQKLISKAVKKIYKKRDVYLHEPTIDRKDINSINKCLKSKFVSTVGKGWSLWKKNKSIYKIKICYGIK